MMFATFFEIGRRETAFSLLAAASSWTSERTLHQAVAAAFRKCSPLIYTLPCRINKFCELTQHRYGTPEIILCRHSLFTYFCAGLPVNMRNELFAQLTNGERSRTSAPRLPVFIESGNRYGIECPECSIEVRRQIGRRISTCDACIPFSTRCAIHGCSFVNYDAISRTNLVFSRKTSSATLSILYSSTAIKISADGLSCDYRKLLTAALKEKGYLLDSGRVYLRELRDDLARFFADDLEDDRLNYLCRQNGFCASLIHDIPRRDRAIHPVKLTLMIMFLTSSQGRATHKLKTKVVGDKPIIRDRQVESARSKWVAHRESNASASRTETRMSAPALWAWLYRNDRSWLLANQKKPLPLGYQRFKRKPVIPECVRKVFTIVKPAFGVENTLPLIRSTYKQRIFFGLTDHAITRIGEETGAISRFAAVPGEREISLAQRVFWAMETLRLDRCTLSEWEIARRASIRTSSITKAIVAMDPH